MCEKQGLYAKFCSSLPSCSKSYFIGHTYYSLLWLIIICYRVGGIFQESHISEHGYSTNFHEMFLEMTPQKIL